MTAPMLLPRHGIRLTVEGFDLESWGDAVAEFGDLFRSTWRCLPRNVKRDLLACWRLWAPIRTARLLRGRDVYPRDCVVARPLDREPGRRFGQHCAGRIEFDLARLSKRSADGIREVVAHEAAHLWLFATDQAAELQARGGFADGRDADLWWHNLEETRVRELVAQWGFGSRYRPPKVPDKRDCDFRRACRMLAPV